jgi:hypothetical protein
MVFDKSSFNRCEYMINGSTNLASSSFLRILTCLLMRSLRVVLPSRIADVRVIFFKMFPFGWRLVSYNFQYAYEIFLVL